MTPLDPTPSAPGVLLRWALLLIPALAVPGSAAPAHWGPGARPVAATAGDSTPAELAERIVNTSSARSRTAQFEKLVSLARSTDADMAAAARVALGQCLPRVFEKAAKRLNTGANVRAFAGLVAQKTRVDALRAEALGLIFDEALYPHPYAAPDAPAESVAAYTKSSEQLTRIFDELQELAASSEEVRFARDLRDYSGRAQWARFQAKAVAREFELPIEMPPFEGPAWLMGLPFELEVRSIDLSNFASSPEEALRLAQDRAVEEWNEGALRAARGRARGRTAKAELDLAGAILRLTNDHRRFLGLGAAAWSEPLALAAAHHAEFLVTAEGPTHDQPDEAFRTYRARARHFGYEADVLENCYFDLVNPEIVFGVWIRSPGHHRAILWSPMCHVGVSHRKRRWVQVFGLDTAFGSEIQCSPWRN